MGWVKVGHCTRNSPSSLIIRAASKVKDCHGTVVTVLVLFRV